MLFKILHGDKSRISTDITPYHEGYCYVTYDGDFYVDMNGERIKLNAKDAETLAGMSYDDIMENIGEIIGRLADSSHDHDDQYYTESEIDDKLNEKANVNHEHENVITVEGGGSLVLSEVFGEAPYVIEITNEELEDADSLQSQLNEIRDFLDQKARVQIITWEAGD